jgi:hypothetical protein
MECTPVQALFEATFHIDGYTARADILRQNDKGWHLIEVKSDTWCRSVES